MLPRFSLRTAPAVPSADSVGFPMCWPAAVIRRAARALCSDCGGRLAERQHQPIGPVEERSGMDHIGDRQIV
jgi:hypothetical protein